MFLVLLGPARRPARSKSPSASRSDVRALRREIKQADTLVDQICPLHEKLATPQHRSDQPDLADLGLGKRAGHARATCISTWHAEHPETTRRLRRRVSEFDVIDRALCVELDLLDGIVPTQDRSQRTVTDELLDACRRNAQYSERPPNPTSVRSRADRSVKSR